MAFNNTSAVDICSCVYLITYQALHSPTFRPHAREGVKVSEKVVRRIMKQEKLIIRRKRRQKLLYPHDEAAYEFSDNQIYHDFHETVV